jgi:hypothetical protein
MGLGAHEEAGEGTAAFQDSPTDTLSINCTYQRYHRADKLGAGVYWGKG